jgi:hypothetical protein
MNRFAEGPDLGTPHNEFSQVQAGWGLTRIARNAERLFSSLTGD